MSTDTSAAHLDAETGAPSPGPMPDGEGAALVAPRPGASHPGGAAAPGTAPADGTATAGVGDASSGIVETHPADGTPREISIGALDLETGGHLPDVTLGFQTWGAPNADGSNAVLILHALTGDPHVGDGPDDTDGWWRELVGPGKVIDPADWFVVAPAALGGCCGTTGPASAAPDGQPWGSRFPFITVRDMVNAEQPLLQALGLTSWHAVVGRSMGGARALEWAAMRPDAVSHCIVMASCAATTAEQIAFTQVQTAAIRLDPDFRGGDYYGHGPGPLQGLGIARRIAHLSYRSEAELGFRFGREPQGEENPFGTDSRDTRGRYAVESYLDHQANKLSGRFDANAYLTIAEALMSHDVGRGRGGVEAALGGLTGVEFFIACVDSDRLYFPEQSEQLAAALPGDVDVHYIHSQIGHDGFLTSAHLLEDQLRREVFH
ncbi:MAG: homoserine O-acetyltransferase MetX [Galactobacter sp.]